MLGLTKKQVDTLIIIERITASASVIATLVLIIAFISFKEFRTLSNTLIFYASFANLFANVAALIGGSALGNLNGSLCQFQAFLLEMFMQSDPMWSLAMAVNVYLVFFRRYDASRLKKLYWIYGLLCYGVPFIPAMLWCWIDDKWAPLRIYSYYAPIWVAILAALIIYVLVGIEIFQKRSQLRAAARGDGSETLNTTSHNNLQPFTGLRTTDIEVSHGHWTTIDIASAISPASIHSRADKVTEGNYSITISSPNTQPPIPRTSGLPLQRPRSMDKVKWAYTKVAVLFAVSILITWAPASANRVYGLRYPEHPSYVLNVASAIVLPLQGLWNMVIFFTTSISICKKVVARLRTRNEVCGFRRLDIVHLGGRREKGSESIVELSTSRSRISRSESI